jgi:hypothetical protein
MLGLVATSFCDLPPDLVARCLLFVPPETILSSFLPASLICSSIAKEEELWEHIFYKNKQITKGVAGHWRANSDSWLTVYREYSTNEWLHGIWWMEAYSPDDAMGSILSASRGGLLHVRADPLGLIGEMIRPSIEFPEDDTPLGLGLMGQELVHVRQFHASTLIRKHFKPVCEIHSDTAASSSPPRYVMAEESDWTVLRGTTGPPGVFVTRADIRTAEDESVMHGRSLERFMLRRGTAAGEQGPPSETLAPRCLAWVRVQSFASPPPAPAPAAHALAELCGVWMGEYGSHGLQLLLLSCDVAGLTPLHAAHTSIRGPPADAGRREAEALESLDVVAIKLTGDPNVPAGQVSFCASAAPRPGAYRCRCCYGCACPGEGEPGVAAVYAARLQTAQHGFLNPRWNAAELAPLPDGTLLMVWTGMHSRRLRRVGPPCASEAALAAELPLRPPHDALPAAAAHGPAGTA